MFKTIAEVRASNKKAGRHFFDRDAMKFFNSRIESRLIAGRYFVTSEMAKSGLNPLPRRVYTIRFASDSGAIGMLMGNRVTYPTKANALAALRDHLATEPNRLNTCNV